MDINDSIRILMRKINSVLDSGVHSAWLYGSVALDDFRLGWSDIDVIVFAEGKITHDEAKELVSLRQKLSAQYPSEPYFGLFEGVIVSLSEFKKGEYTGLVYWGASGQRITNRFALDAFSRYELSESGILLFGNADRSLFVPPSRSELVDAVRAHYEGIRRCAVKTDESLYSCGWLLDIARCLFTLRHNRVISKTQAGEWALEKGLFPDEAALKKTLEIRRSPLEYKNRDDIKAWLCGLGPVVQAYADVLEAELAFA